MNVFDVTHVSSDCCARTGVLHLLHGDVATPVFMPVGTNAAIKALPFSDVEDEHFSLILANTYHLAMRPGVEAIHQMGGLHSFSSWSHNFLTDSGGFQAFSLASLSKFSDDGIAFSSHLDGSHHFFTPENVCDMQLALRSDIQMALDVCLPPSASYDEAAQAMHRTISWAKRAKLRWEKGIASFAMQNDNPLNAIQESRNGNDSTKIPLLFPIVQGHFNESLRQEAALATIDLALPGIAIGGLSVGEDDDTFFHFLDITMRAIHSGADEQSAVPVYVMGIGSPRYVLYAIKLGVDMMDCVLPSRNARNGSLFTSLGPISIKQARYALDASPIDESCSCAVCRRYSRSYLHHLFKAHETAYLSLATRHNLHFFATLLDDARNQIARGNYAVWMEQFLARYERGEKG